ncbi:MAG: orotidine-5'-phosphate decarboxylase [Elusimicrobia bacterium]|nr:orotidine-5'-phosphate decarboxylase [Elusimicrobiota bacterium]
MPEIIVALDFDDLEKARETVLLLKSEIKFFKVGLQLFTRCGKKSIEMVKSENREVFFDIKVFDIPKICAKVSEFAAKAGCYSMTIHISAGDEALRQAKKNQIGGFPHLWGVTVLSSLAEGDSLAGAATAAKLALEGVIVSGGDIKKVREEFPMLEIASPGIRPAGYGRTDDQKRILTPAGAVKSGSDFLVVGRPITEAENPLEVVRQMKKEISENG